MLSEAKTTDYTKLLSTEAGLRAVTKWFLERDFYPVLAGEDDGWYETKAERTKAGDVCG